MSCCKDNLLLYLKIENHQKTNSIFIETVKNTVESLMGFTKEQTVQVVDYAIKHGKCLVAEGTKEEIRDISITLAKKYISAEVQNKSMK